MNEGEVQQMIIQAILIERERLIECIRQAAPYNHYTVDKFAQSLIDYLGTD